MTLVETREKVGAGNLGAKQNKRFYHVLSMFSSAKQPGANLEQDKGITRQWFIR